MTDQLDDKTQPPAPDKANEVPHWIPPWMGPYERAALIIAMGMVAAVIVLLVGLFVMADSV